MELAKSMDFRTNKWVLQCAYKKQPDICVYLYIAVAGINRVRSQCDRDNLWAARGKPSTTMCYGSRICLHTRVKETIGTAHKSNAHQ